MGMKIRQLVHSVQKDPLDQGSVNYDLSGPQPIFVW